MLLGQPTPILTNHANSAQHFFTYGLTVGKIDESAFRVDLGLWKYNAISSFLQPHESLARKL